MKTNKSISKRLKIRKGEILHRKSGINHFRAKKSGVNKLNRKNNMKKLQISGKAKSRFLVGISK